MKAAVYRRYGPPDVVKIEEVKKPVPKDDECFVTALAISPFVSQKVVPFIAKLNSKGLATIAELMASAKVRPVINKCYSLAETAEATISGTRSHPRKSRDPRDSLSLFPCSSENLPERLH
jgi:NADPH:quinone reductase-like Zn-dependent oxidoreductase